LAWLSDPTLRSLSPLGATLRLLFEKVRQKMQLLKLKEALIFFGGINASTLYRGIKLGRYPRPVKVGPQSSRWILEECEEALRRMVAGRAV
jgi:predicted DNA-binding transcriptional regulator AlpA